MTDNYHRPSFLVAVTQVRWQPSGVSGLNQRHEHPSQSENSVRLAVSSDDGSVKIFLVSIKDLL